MSGTLWSTRSRRATSCRSSVLLCRRVGTSWWNRSGTSICTSPSRLSKCPRSRLYPVVLAGARFLVFRRRNSWWKYRNSCSYRVLSSLGLPGWFRHAYFESHAHVRMRFKLASGLGEPWTRDGGIPQGCPLSMMFIVALYLPWCL